MQDPRPVFTANGSPATQGVCPVCGTKMFRIGRTPAHEGLAVEEHTVVSKAQQKRASGPKLVIVESPAKARTVGRFLGKGYAVRASVGHIRDLPANRMGVDIENDFEPHYVIPTKKKEVVRELRQEAKKASAVYLATDPDREGEAISWHLVHALERAIGRQPVHRVEFHEITRPAVDHAFAHPREIDMQRVDAQQARRVLDRLVGYSLSPLLREKMERKRLSAGRVQSVALRLVVEREREIEAFVPVEYWSLEAELAKREEKPKDKPFDPAQDKRRTFIAKLHRLRGEKPDLKNEADAMAIVDALESAIWIVTRVKQGTRRRRPSPPYTTSTMQQEASRRLRFTKWVSSPTCAPTASTWPRLPRRRRGDTSTTALAKSSCQRSHLSTRPKPKAHRRPTRPFDPPQFGVSPKPSRNTSAATNTVCTTSSGSASWPARWRQRSLTPCR
jgi:DNA topoisomerase-1